MQIGALLIQGLGGVKAGEANRRSAETQFIRICIHQVTFAVLRDCGSQAKAIRAQPFPRLLIALQLPRSNKKNTAKMRKNNISSEVFDESNGSTKRKDEGGTIP